MPFFQKSIRSDEDLLSALREGSEDAFTVIYERYHKLLYVLAYKYLKNSFAAEDAVQQGLSAFSQRMKRMLSFLSRG